MSKTTKKKLYERTFRTADYYIYDPFNPQSLEGWHLDAKQRYQTLVANNRGWLWCESLGLWLGTWNGSVRREPPAGTCQWLRFYDLQENLVLLPEEIAEQERQRADQKQQQAKQERQRADQEQQQAEQERQRADQERQRAEIAQSRAERLAARLRELGEEPDSV